MLTIFVIDSILDVWQSSENVVNLTETNLQWNKPETNLYTNTGL